MSIPNYTLSANYALASKKRVARAGRFGVGPQGRLRQMANTGDAVQVVPGTAGPNTTVSFGGDAPIMDARVALLFYGSAWNNLSFSPNCVDIQNAIQTLLATPYTSQLIDYQCNGATYNAIWNRIVTNPPGNPFDPTDCGGVANDIINNYYSTLPPYNQPNLYAFFLPPGVTAASQFPGAHSNDGNIYYSWQIYGSLNSTTTLFSHELVEAMTDPNGNVWQVDPRDSGPNGSWNEIADVCNNTSLPVNGVQAAAYFSTQYKACVVPQPDPPPPPPPSLPNGDYQISCAMFAYHNGHPYIGIIGGTWNGQNWAMLESDAISRMQKGELTFYTLADGERADVSIGISRTNNEYLTTSPDGTQKNNLDYIASNSSCDTGPGFTLWA
jgi:hypothetical protein